MTSPALFQTFSFDQQGASKFFLKKILVVVISDIFSWIFCYSVIRFNGSMGVGLFQIHSFNSKSCFKTQKIAIFPSKKSRLNSEIFI